MDTNKEFDEMIDDDDFDAAADQPLNRQKEDFVPFRDPLVAALFGPAVRGQIEHSLEQEAV